MKKEEFIALANKYKAGLCSHEEQVRYEKIFEEIQREGSLAPEWEETTKENKRKKILSRIELTRLEKKKERKQYRIRVGQWAASVLFLMGAGLATFFFNDQETEIEYLTKTTIEGQRSRITLSDGSVVVLNSNSQLSYPEKFSETSREIILSGEAFFEVQKDSGRPFIVRSGDVVTTVLGTSFNVRAFGTEHVEVTVVTGKVKVAADAFRKEVFLEKGQQANYSMPLGDITIQDVSAAQYTSWITRSLDFDMIPFRDVVKILERAYNTEIRIRTAASDKCLVRGKYENEKLVNVLNGLKWVVNFDYHFAGDGVIIIDGKGCIN